MKYTPKQYATAFTALVAEGIVSEKEIVGNFMSTIERNGDVLRREEIFRETDKALRRAYGKRTVVLETARPLEGLQRKFGAFITKNDIVEEKVSTSLVAGVRVTVDDENQFDGTLKGKIDKLFSRI